MRNNILPKRYKKDLEDFKLYTKLKNLEHEFLETEINNVEKILEIVNKMVSYLNEGSMTHRSISDAIRRFKDEEVVDVRAIIELGNGVRMTVEAYKSSYANFGYNFLRDARIEDDE